MKRSTIELLAVVALELRLENRRITTQDTKEGQQGSGTDSSEVTSDGAASVVQNAVELTPGVGEVHEHHLQQVIELRKKRLNLAVVRFVGGWLFFMLLILGVVLLTNLQWARPRVEAAMSESFHRKVYVGQLSWTLGLNGLAIWTDRLKMVEANGKPFIVSGQAELGIAVLPLFHQRLIIKHVQFQNPEVFAIQTAPGKWNFSDLLVEGPEIRYVQVEKGRLHLINEITGEQLANSKVKSVFANTNWHTYDFEDVSINLIFPNRKQIRQWPFYLSFKLPRESGGKKYVSTFSLTVLANGSLEDWKKKKSTIEVRGEHINPADWRPFLRLPDGVSGAFDFKFKGKGILDDVLAGDVSATVNDVAYVQGGETMFSAKKADMTAKVLLRPDGVQWEKLNLSFAGMAVDSHGELTRWNDGKPIYNAVVTADLKRLDDLHQTSLWKFWPGANAKKDKADLSGAAKIQINIASDGKQPTITTSLKADSIPLTNLMAGGADGTGFLSLFQIKPDAAIKGRINIEADQRVSLSGVEIPAQGSVVQIDGWFNANKKEHDVELKALGLALDKFDTEDFNGITHKPTNNSIMLSGKVDVNAHLKGGPTDGTTSIAATLHKAVISAGKTTLSHGLDGAVTYDGKVVKFQKIAGIIANRNGTIGSINLAGWLQTDAGGKCDLDISGRNVDVAQLISFCRLAKIPLPEQAVANLSGIAREIQITAKGEQAKPQLSIRLTPEDLDYQLGSAGGSKLRPLKISGGTIVATAAQLEVKDVPIVAQSGKIIVTATFSGSGNNMAAKTIHLRSNGIDISELQNYLSSQAVPSTTRATLGKLIAPLQLTGVQGKAFGDVTVKNQADRTQTVEGVIGFQNTSGKVGSKLLAFDHLSGVVSVSNTDLSIQDVTVQSAGSKFTLHGDVKNYQRNPIWNIQMQSQLKPQELSRYLGDGTASGKMTITAAGPVALRASIIGEATSNRILLTAKAEPGDRVTVNGGGFWFEQPEGLPMSIEAAMVHRPGKVSTLGIESFQVLLGDSQMQGTGKYEWTDDPDHVPVLDFNMSAPTAIPTTVFVAALQPQLSSSGMVGSIKPSFSFVGPVNRLVGHGEAVLAHVSIPLLELKDAQGKITSPRWNFLPSGIAANEKSEAHLALSGANIGGMNLQDFTGVVVLDHSTPSRFVLRDGKAQLAGGRISIAGSYKPRTSQWRVDLDLSRLLVDQFVTDMIERSGEVTGLADGKIVIESAGKTRSEIVNNLSGHGNIDVTKGTVPRLGQLHEKLTQSNLLQQGIFGFNINNVFQSMLPVKTGQFKQSHMEFSISDGVVDIEQLNYDGNDIRLRAAGTWNIAQNTIHVDVAGNIPRVSSSILPGAVGQVSRNFTLQKAVRVVTFRKLQNLPNIPILGDIGTDDPRAFTFKISGGLESPNTVAHSIEKTFKWLPNKPDASAHPIPGML